MRESRYEQGGREGGRRSKRVEIGGKGAVFQLRHPCERGGLVNEKGGNSVVIRREMGVLMEFIRGLI